MTSDKDIEFYAEMARRQIAQIRSHEASQLLSDVVARQRHREIRRNLTK